MSAFSSIRVAVFALAAGGIGLAAAPAEAKIKDLKFHVATTQFDDVPSMEMVADDSGYHWVDQGKNFNIRIKILMKSVGSRITSAYVGTNGGSNLWVLPAGYKTYDYEQLISTAVGKAYLTPFQNNARALCDVFGGSTKVVRDMELSLRLWASAGSDFQETKNTMNVKVVCGPKPAPKPMVFAVTSLQLYASPAKGRCGEPVKLYAEVRTTYPGKVDFTLHRKDGEKQNVSVTTAPDGRGGFVNRWSKQYLYDASIKREYKVVLKDQPLTTPWIPVEVQCGVGTDANRPAGLAK